VIEVPHKLDEPDQICTACGGPLEEWGGQIEESEDDADSSPQPSETVAA
jgi:hypothetical protein